MSAYVKYRIVHKYTGILLATIDAASRRSAILKANNLRGVYTGSFFVFECY